MHVRAERENEDERQRHQRGGQRDPEVLAEFILHRAALTVAGGDGGVRNEGEVVAEHRSAHDGRDAQRETVPRSGGYRQRDRDDERDGADGGAHRGGHKAAYHEQHRHGILRRDDRQQKIRDALRTAAADDADKYSGGHEYEYHGDDVLVADALAHKLKLFVKAQGAVLKTGDEQRDQERHDDGYLVEAHADLQHVHENYAETEIYDQKYAYGQKRDSVAFFHAFSSVCENAPVLLLRTGAMRSYCAFFL